MLDERALHARHALERAKLARRAALVERHADAAMAASSGADDR